MNDYEIRLVCPFCGTFTVLGTVQAESVFDAKHEAARRWPDARYEEMVTRLCSNTLSDVPRSTLEASLSWGEPVSS